MSSNQSDIGKNWSAKTKLVKPTKPTEPKAPPAPLETVKRRQEQVVEGVSIRYELDYGWGDDPSGLEYVALKGDKIATLYKHLLQLSIDTGRPIEELEVVCRPYNARIEYDVEVANPGLLYLQAQHAIAMEKYREKHAEYLKKMEKYEADMKTYDDLRTLADYEDTKAKLARLEQKIKA